MFGPPLSALRTARALLRPPTLLLPLKHGPPLLLPPLQTLRPNDHRPQQLPRPLLKKWHQCNGDETQYSSPTLAHSTCNTPPNTRLRTVDPFPTSWCLALSWCCCLRFWAPWHLQNTYSVCPQTTVYRRTLCLCQCSITLFLILIPVPILILSQTTSFPPHQHSIFPPPSLPQAYRSGATTSGPIVRVVARFMDVYALPIGYVGTDRVFILSRQVDLAECQVPPGLMSMLWKWIMQVCWNGSSLRKMQGLQQRSSAR